MLCTVLGEVKKAKRNVNFGITNRLELLTANSIDNINVTKNLVCNNTAYMLGCHWNKFESQKVEFLLHGNSKSKMATVRGDLLLS